MSYDDWKLSNPWDDGTYRDEDINEEDYVDYDSYREDFE